MTRLAATLALATTLLSLGGCDGGIFGTGDGSSSGGGPPIDAVSPEPDPGTPSGGLEPGPLAPEAVPGDSDALAGGADVSDPAPDETTGTGMALVNTLAVDPSASEPRIRIVNASTSGVALVGDGDVPGAVNVPFVAPGTVSAFIRKPDGVSSLELYQVQAPGGVAGRSLRLGPLFIDAASVTTLLVRDVRPGPAITVLPTRIASDDPMLALVRIVSGGGADDDASPSAVSYTLVPAGANPGGAEVAFGAVMSGDAVNPDYRAVFAGDYRLESSVPGAPSRALSFEGGAVRTLVVVGGDELLVVEDGG